MSLIKTVQDFYGLTPAPVNGSGAHVATGTEEDTAYGMAALAGECEAVARAGEGTRNATLNAAAYKVGRVIAAGKLTPATAAANLAAAGRACGLPVAEVELILRANSTGALSAGQGNPRVVEDLPERQEISEWTAPSPNDSPSATSSDTISTDTESSTEDSTPNIAGVAGAGSDIPEHTSWWFRDLAAVLDGSAVEPDPTHLARDDERRLFYAGKVNGLLGESESGKTWVALLAVLQALHVGESVLYLDFEDTAAGIIGRLRSLGATEEELGRLAYIDPDESLHMAARADLEAVLSTHKPDLIILDGFNAAMTLLGLDLQSNKDATVFSQALLRPMSRTKATVIYVDHLPKNKEAQGKGGIGAQAKRAMTTGCALRVDVAQEFGRGMTGRLKLTVDKDRAGHVRAVSGGAKNAGTAVIESSPDGKTVTLRIEGPDLRPIEERGPWRPTGLMEKVSRFLESGPGPWSFRNVKESVKGKDDYLRAALDALVEDGYAVRDPGARGASLHRAIRSFREDFPTVSPPCPTVSRDTVIRPCPVSPTLGGDTDTVANEGLISDRPCPAGDEDQDDDPDPWWQR